jgi:hypothetical protein
MTNSSGNGRATAWAAAVDRLSVALDDPDRLFTQAEVAFLRSAAQAYGYELRRREEREPDPLSYRAGLEAGYRQRVAEENGEYPPEPVRLVTTAGQDAVMVHRKRVGVDVVAPRESDFAGLGDAYVAELRQRWALDETPSADTISQ